MQNSLNKMKATIKNVFQKRKKPIAALLILMLTFSVGYALAKIFWSQNLTYTFNVTGISAGLLSPGAQNYHDKVNASTLDGNNQVGLVIYAENFHNIWLNISWSSTAQGLTITETGQYFQVTEDSSFTPYVTPIGSPFNVTGYNVIDKTQMMYKTPGWGVVGGELIVTFNFNTEAVTIPGTYTVNLNFQMGFT